MILTNDWNCPRVRKRRLYERSFDLAQDMLLRSNLLRNKYEIASSRKKRGIRKDASAFLGTGPIGRN